MTKPSKKAGAYEVGYGKPPVHTRFQPGTSGNPRGRPKGRTSPSALIDKILAQKVTFSDGRAVRRVSLLEAGLISVSAKAAKGDLKAMQFVLNLVEQARALEPDHDVGALDAEDLALIEQFAVQLKGGSEPASSETQTDRERDEDGPEET